MADAVSSRKAASRLRFSAAAGPASGMGGKVGDVGERCEPCAKLEPELAIESADMKDAMDGRRMSPARSVDG